MSILKLGQTDLDSRWTGLLGKSTWITIEMTKIFGFTHNRQCLLNLLMKKYPKPNFPGHINSQVGWLSFRIDMWPPSCLNYNWFSCRCSCLQCKVWPVNTENVCCQEQQRVKGFLESYKDPEAPSTTPCIPLCITHHPAFCLNCLEPWVLRTAYWQYKTQYNASLTYNENQ
jgi:hypothetical protein